MTSSMFEALLIEEAGDRATARLHHILPLMLLSFTKAEAHARSLAAASPGRIIDPIASACLAEARVLLLRPASTRASQRAGLFAAIFALDAAASREPECYAPAHQAVRALVLSALDEVVALELAGSIEVDVHAEPLALERLGN